MIIYNISAKQTNHLADGSYEVQVSMEGGTGKAYITSPTTVQIVNGNVTATFIWSSKNYDYMIVNGVKYLNENEGGQSTFTVSLGDTNCLYEPVSIIADTTAMSVPHEIEYTITLTLCGDSMQSQSASKNTLIESEKTEYFDNWESENLKYATQFTIQKSGNLSLITIGGLDNSKQFLLVVPEGETVPGDVPSNVIVLKKPFDKTYLVSTSAMDLIRQAEALNQIRLSGTKAKDWYIPEVQEAMNKGDILYAGKYSAPDYELILGEGCNLAIENSMIFHNPEAKEKLEELGIPVIVEMSSYEKHPLGRLEWIKLYGILYGKEDIAESYFNEQMARVEAIKKDDDSGLKIAFFSINSSGLITVRKSGDYVSQMIELVGGEYVPENKGEEENNLSTMNMQMEDFYYQVKDADILIYNSAIVGEIFSIDDLIRKSSLFSEFKAVKSGQVYCTGKNLFQQTTGMAEFMEDLKNVCDGNEDDLHYLSPLK